MKFVFLELVLYLVIDVFVVISLIKLLQRIVSQIARTTNPRFHTIYQGGELLQAKTRRYSSNLYVLILIFLILHIFTFFFSTLALINAGAIAIEVIVFMLMFIYLLFVIRKGVSYL